MKKLVIEGKTKLSGNIHISGAKNAALPILVSSLLADGELKLFNLPNVVDISSMSNLLVHLGVKMNMDCNLTNKDSNGKVVNYCARGLKNCKAPYDIVKTMRASFIVMGPLLARLGKAIVSLPGGDSIGVRPVDIHLKAFEQMGAKIKVEQGYVYAKAKGGKLNGANIMFRLPSVGATQNIMMAATLARGTTIINNAAKEPEIVDLANCLNAMGAKVFDAGTNIITIEGVKRLHSAEYRVMGDRIEAATYMIAAAITDGDIIIDSINVFETLKTVVEKLQEIGINIERLQDDKVRISRKEKKLKPAHITTQFYPGFPTDVQGQIMTLLALVDGKSSIDETIFENRFMHVPELNRMGANIYLEGSKANIDGHENCFKNAPVMATDIRASVSLVLAGMCAKGQTIIDRIYHLERGYEFLADKLNKCGANLKVINPR
jgi:UDP-N-acetylglucosamine 1-carboxyvinyltransferase